MRREAFMVMSDPRYSQGMSWITHRPPTEADADVDGDVIVDSDTFPKTWITHINWQNVHNNQRWWSPLAADAANLTDEYAQAKLELLRAKLRLVNAQYRRDVGLQPSIDLESMSDEAFYELQRKINDEADKRQNILPIPSVNLSEAQ
jgi:hypothetical protein